MSDRSKTLRETIEKDEAGVLERWIDKQLAAPSFRSDRISKTELAEQTLQRIGVRQGGPRRHHHAIRPQAADQEKQEQDRQAIQAQAHRYGHRRQAGETPHHGERG